MTDKELWNARPIQGKGFSASDHFKHFHVRRDEAPFPHKPYGIDVCHPSRAEIINLYVNDEIISLSPLDARRLVLLLLP